MNAKTMLRVDEKTIMIPSGNTELEVTLGIPPNAVGIVLIAQGTGTNRHSPRNRFLADELRQQGLATLMADLLTPEEEAYDLRTGNLRYNVDLLARRVIDVTDWIDESERTMRLNMGILGSGVGAAAAMIAAVERPEIVKAIVSKGGRTDLAGNVFSQIEAPTLLIVGGFDYTVADNNRKAYARLGVPKDLIVIPEATHLFEEPGTLEEVARLASKWFQRYLDPAWKPVIYELISP
jgi:alpha-beta hydrolase superfamily lysophospholipase